MREAAWMPARKSGRRLMVLMIPATVPLGLTDLACAYTSASGPFASDSSTIRIRATTLLTTFRRKSVGGQQPWRVVGQPGATLSSAPPGAEGPERCRPEPPGFRPARGCGLAL